MADIRCPNCGKNNPEDLEICQFCETILPASGDLASASGDDLMSLLGSNAEDEDVPDWLQELRPDEEPDSEAPETGDGSVPAFEGDDSLLDLLEGETEADAGEVFSGDDDDDWMSRLEDSAALLTDDEPAAADAEPADPAVELEAWLARDDDEDLWSLDTPLESDSSSPAAADDELEEALPVSGEAKDDTLDWLSSLEQLDGGSEAEPELDLFSETLDEPASEGEDDLGLWETLEETAEGGLELTPGEEPEEGESDWLDQFGDEKIVVQDVEQALEEKDEEVEPLAVGDTALEEDFLTDEQVSETEAEESFEVSLDEITQFSREEADAEPAESVPVFQSDDLDEEADWVVEFGEGDLGVEDETMIQTGEPKPAGVDDLPDWFAESLTESEDGQAEVVEETASPFTEDIEEDLFETSDQPDWFREAQEEPEISSEPVHAAEDMPDWLQQAGEGETPFSSLGSGVESEAPQVDPDVQPVSSEPEPSEGETPEWLGDLGTQDESEAEELGEVNFASFSLQEGEDVPEWLSRLDTGGPQDANGAGVPAFLIDEEGSPFDVDEDSVDLPSDLEPEPEWLDKIDSGEALPPMEEGADQGEEPGLEPAELPGWLEAMRPSETGAASGPYRDTTDERTESSGLLSGLPGILPGEYNLDRVTKPPVYSIKLHLSQDQQDRVDLLKEMLDEEEQTAPERAPAAIPTPVILRLLILGAFILGAFFAFIAGVQQTPVPETGSIPAEVMDLRRTLDELQNGSPVLVAFDYQPASVPELEAASLPVIDQLIVKGSVIRTISNNHSGPLLAKHLIERVLEMPDRQQLPQPDFANLGYIPGGAAGLQAFVRDPASIMRYNLESTDSESLDAWQAPGLDPNAGLANFGLVLVLTDQADNARTWVEQAGQSLQENDIPLIMVVSAQADPMVRPYYASNPRQIAGFASGVMGGVFLENLRGRAGPARLYLDAYSLTLMVAIFLLVIGSLVNLVAGQVTGNTQIKGEGKA